MTDRQLANGLGWFSIGLGLTEIAAPEWLGRLIGVGEDHSGLLRAMGVREVVTGLGVLTQSKPTFGMWGRVAGDLLDLSLLAAAMKSPDSEKGRLAGATGAVLGVGLLDLICARQLQAEPSWA